MILVPSISVIGVPTIKACGYDVDEVSVNWINIANTLTTAGVQKMNLHSVKYISETHSRSKHRDKRKRILIWNAFARIWLTAESLKSVQTAIVSRGLPQLLQECLQTHLSWPQGDWENERKKTKYQQTILAVCMNQNRVSVKARGSQSKTSSSIRPCARILICVTKQHFTFWIADIQNFFRRGESHVMVFFHNKKST